MPVVEQEVLSPGRYLLRHGAPEAAAENTPGIVAPAGSGLAVLGQTLYAQPLPVSHLPQSPDFHEGDYSLRLNDAGDFKLSFPNRDASAGQPWRARFNSTGHTHFVEISREGNVEFVGVIVKLTRDRQKVEIDGYDGFWLLKKSFEQDYTAIMAPRDLIERYTALPVILQGDNFPPGEEPAASPFELAATGTEKGATAYCELNPNGGVRCGYLETPKGGGTVATCFIGSRSAGFNFVARQPWRATAPFFALKPALTNNSQEATLWLQTGGGVNAQVSIQATSLAVQGELNTTAGDATRAAISGGTASGAHTLTMESDGRWIRGFVDGVLVGLLPDRLVSTASAKITLKLNCHIGEVPPNIQQDFLVPRLTFSQNQAFLMRGTDKGDYVLPGTASTYPYGGLHARYIVNGATASTEKWWETILSPDPRRPGFPTYLESQQVVNNEGATSLPPGVPETFFAVRFFGAIYLKLSLGYPNFTLAHVDGARVWVGKTRMGDQIIDDWKTGVWRNNEVIPLPAGLGNKDGWYPIIVEHFVASTTPPHCELYFTIPAGPGYTDPGGTVLAGGGQVKVPATSLSPLGCVDARIQGSSYFDIVQEQARNAGYQLWCEPKQLESGEFPGQVVPRLRVGRDTDEIIEPDDIDRKSGMDNYSQVLDSTDSAASVKAFGSGIADGKGSQIAYEAVSIPDENASLFDLQAWVQAGDIAFPALLGGRAEAELGLRRGAWESLTGEPIARDRLADTFPLTGALSQFRWRPGDGVRLLLPDIGVIDSTPRAMLQVSRSFGPEGRMNTHVGFRARPKDPLYALRTMMREATRSPRSFQRQYVSRVSGEVSGALAPAGFTNYSEVSLTPQDKVVSAFLNIGVNTSKQPLGVEINGVDRTFELGGPWTSSASINMLQFAKPNSLTNDHRLYLRLKNTGGAEEAFCWCQFVLTLLA